MTRKLLPYEYELIDALGVSKEDYLDFVAQQHIHEDIKDGTVLDIRNEPVSIILAVVGILLQVVSMLLMPKPPDQEGSPQTRDQRLSPRTGFNGAQELAVYGETVPLVYTSMTQNPNGGVRVSTLLLWSAILSFGNSQFMRLMMTIGASTIRNIDPNRTAIGQLPAKDIALSNVWQYFRPNGPTTYANLVRGTGVDPTLTGTIAQDTTAKINGIPNRAEGFSQCFSPTTANAVGVTGFIPINADVLVLGNEGLSFRGFNNISYNPQYAFYNINTLITVVFGNTITPPLDDPLEEARQNARRAAAGIIDNGIILKSGSALFRVNRITYNNNGSSIDEGDLFVELICIRPGNPFSFPYAITHYLDDPENRIALFHAKGFARIEQAAYVSVTRCNVLDFALKCSVYRRLSGRSNTYGTGQINYGHNASQNGNQPRTAMFRIEYRFDNSGDYAFLPFIFCVRGLNEQTVFTYFKLFCPLAAVYMEVRLEPVVDSFAESGAPSYCYLEPTGSLQTLTAADTGDSRIQVFFNGTKYGPSPYPPLNKSPYPTFETDLFSYDAFSNSVFSFDNGPEISITAVNEQTIEPWSGYSPTLYQGLSNFALHLFSGAGTQDVRDISVWVNEGKILRPLNENTPDIYTTTTQKENLRVSTPSATSSYAPEIFLDTIIDRDNGIGKFATLHSVDVVQLARSKKFCVTNSFFMDGLIGDARSWRDFWSQTAPFSLLELAKIGGMETLVPAVPYNPTTGAMTRVVAISALFNQGNILEGTYKEEFIDYGTSTQDVIVTVIYRDVERNGAFPRNNSVEIRLTTANENNAIRETIDASQFVTSRVQAVVLGKFLCQTRRHTRRSVEFQTFPTDSSVSPGSYIYVETSNNRWDGIYTGRIEAGGVLNLPITGTVPNGTYNVLTYGSTNGTRSFTGIAVTNNTAVALASVAGELFVLGAVVTSKRVFRVIEVSMEEEGETTVRAVEHPCDSAGNSLIANGLTVTNSGLFTVDGIAG